MPATKVDLVLYDGINIPAALRHGVASLRSAFQAPDPDTVGILAGFAVLVQGMFWNLANVVLLIVYALATMLDVLSGIAKAYRTRTQDGETVNLYCPEKLIGGAVGKLLRASVIVFAGGLDLVGAVLVSQLTGPEAGDLVKMVAPLFKASLCWFIYAEGKSYLRNVTATAGATSVPPFVVRVLDRLKTGGIEPPARRHYDADALRLEAELRKEGGNA